MGSSSGCVGLARVELRKTLSAWGLAEIEDTALLVLSELVTNAVRHAVSQPDFRAVGPLVCRSCLDGPHAITLGSTARVHLHEARELTRGLQELTPAEVDYKLSWWSMTDALDAVAEGRFHGKVLVRSAPVGRPAVR